MNQFFNLLLAQQNCPTSRLSMQGSAQPLTSNEDDVSVNFTVQLSMASCKDITVAYQVAGDAVSGVHYNSLSGSFVIPKGQTSATVNYNLQQNGIAEVEKYLKIALKGSSNFANVILGSNITQVPEIIDDDTLIYKNVIKVRSGSGPNHSCAMDGDNKLKCWGSGNVGQRGDGFVTIIPYPQYVIKVRQQ